MNQLSEIERARIRLEAEWAIEEAIEALEEEQQEIEDMAMNAIFLYALPFSLPLVFAAIVIAVITATIFLLIGSAFIMCAKNEQQN